MPKDLKDFPRPPGDNGRGLHGSASVGWSGGKEGYDFWISELVALGVKWLKVLDRHGDSVPFCEKLLAAGIFPIVRILRQDPPPNDTPQPNPGHINNAEEETIRRLVATGVRYFETNNEPNLGTEWKNGAMPGDALESAKLVALNWLFDARFILAAGGCPGLPAISVGGSMDLMGALVTLGRQDILLEGCWIALHNYGQNHPIDFPDDPVNRTGQPLTPAQYDRGEYTQWAWWREATGRADSLDEINALRAAGKNPTQTIQQDHACFREFEYYDSLAIKYLGRSIPIISTEGGYRVGRREDARYPRITPISQRDLTVTMFDYVQRQAPDYYFAAVPWLMLESPGVEKEAWYGSFWQRAFQQGPAGRNGIPAITVPGAALGDRLPVVDAVKAMPNLARRMPGIQPAPPSVQPVVVAPKPAPLRYVVVSGDTLSKIAKQFGTTWQDIAALNQLATPDLIRAGQTLLIPRPADVEPIAAPETLPAPSPALPGLSALFPDTEPELTTPVPLAAIPTPPPAAAPVSTTPPPAPTPTPPPAAAPVSTTPPPAPISTPPPLPRSVEVVESVAPASLPHAPVQIPAAPLPTRPTAAPPPHAPEVMTPAPAPIPALAPPPKFPDLTAPPIELEWDWRLDALGVLVEPAGAAPGQERWRLVRAVYQAPDESAENHHIYYILLDEHGQPVANQKVWQGWANDKADATTDEEGKTNIPLWASFAPDRESGPYAAWVEGLPSDRVVGMGLPFKRHVNFLLTWQRTLA